VLSEQGSLLSASYGIIDERKPLLCCPLQLFLPSQLFALVLRQAFPSLKAAI
jgi:hypothetical protein